MIDKKNILWHYGSPGKEYLSLWSVGRINNKFLKKKNSKERKRDVSQVNRNRTGSSDRGDRLNKDMENQYVRDSLSP